MGILKFKKGLSLYLLPAMLIYSVFFIYPFVQTLYYSFFEWDGILNLFLTALGILKYC